MIEIRSYTNRSKLYYDKHKLYSESRTKCEHIDACVYMKDTYMHIYHVKILTEIGAVGTGATLLFLFGLLRENEIGLCWESGVQGSATQL